jgi:hypothetical protein
MAGSSVVNPTWFNRLSARQQELYLSRHPHSGYHETGKPTAVKNKQAPPIYHQKPHVSKALSLLKSRLKEATVLDLTDKTRQHFTSKDSNALHRLAIGEDDHSKYIRKSLNYDTHKGQFDDEDEEDQDGEDFDNDDNDGEDDEENDQDEESGGRNLLDHFNNHKENLAIKLAIKKEQLKQVGKSIPSAALHLMKKLLVGVLIAAGVVGAIAISHPVMIGVFLHYYHEVTGTHFFDNMWHHMTNSGGYGDDPVSLFVDHVKNFASPGNYSDDQLSQMAHQFRE